MQRRRFAALALALVWGVGPGFAQTVPAAPVAPGAILTLDQNRLFLESAYGRAVQARAEAAEAQLLADNRRIFDALEQEERDLAARRATTPPDDFAKLAAAFDTKVEEIRLAQDAKGRDIRGARDTEEQRFVQTAGPVLGALMTEAGAVAIIDKSVLILSLNTIDITAQAVARLDQVLGDGSAPIPAPEPGPAPAPPAVPNPPPSP